MYFADSYTLDQIAIIDACLHNGYNVARAKALFDKIRASTAADSVLDARLYNTVLEGYLNECARDPKDLDIWIEEAWLLFESMESGNDKALPTALTYAIMLLAWHRYSNPTSASYVRSATKRTPEDFVNMMRRRDISAASVLDTHVLAEPEDHAAVVTLLSRAAIQLGDRELVDTLGVAQQQEEEDLLADVPEVKPVVKPLKILAGDEEIPPEEVPFNLQNLRSSLELMSRTRRLLPDDNLARQKLLEESVYDVAMHRLEHETRLFESLNMAPGLSRGPLRRWMWTWHQRLVEQLESEIVKIEVHERRAAQTSARPHIGPYLRLLRADKLSMLTIMELMRLHSAGTSGSSGATGADPGVKLARALISIAQAVELEHAAQLCRRRKVQLPANTGVTSFFSQSAQARMLQLRLERQKALADDAWQPEWSQITRVKLGAFLVDQLMAVAKIERTRTHPVTGEKLTEEQAAFTHTYEYQRGQKLGVIKLNPLVTECLAEAPVRDLVHPRHLPMVVKPKPWIDHDNGGYLFSRASVMRIKDSQEQLTYLRQASVLGNMELVYSGLDVLGSTPWHINRGVFDVVLEVWNSGQGLGSIPPAKLEEPEPDKPEDETDMQAKVAYLQKLKIWTTNKGNNHSERCSVNYKLEIARAFLGETLYFPHNIDFRGRAYPIPPHLNHMGDDLSRALLQFAESRPLGERGVRWLKIHLSNLYGFDKASFDDRVAFTEKHLDEVFDSADNPLTGNKWWQKAEDQWQCLAACKELTAALRSPDPYAYESCLPVHQDGTCNGLQHYAALGGDMIGAQQVNLDVTERPADVYSFVANMVEAEIAKDAEKGNGYAKLAQGKISRKIVKQTVMTTVYGVTYIGARDQILRQLRDRKDLFHYDDTFGIAGYLARKTLDCIGDLFKGAKDIMSWLTTTSRLIARSIPASRVDEAVADLTDGKAHRNVAGKLNRAKGSRMDTEQMTAVVWTTMLGLPIVQPYRKVKRKQILTNLQTVYISDPNIPTEVDAKKQATAFPPNFIHSLDATHMMLTALECRANNLTFASVHDSYWTHASTIDHMSIIIRDTFIALHGSNVLERLADEFKTRYAGHVVPVLAGVPSAAKKGGPQNSPFIIVSGQEMAQLPGEERDVVVKVKASKASVVEEDAEVEEDEDEEDAGEEDADLQADGKTPRARRMKAARNMTTEALRKSKMVDLWSLVPPLPKKGDFDVNKIKQSMYFFS
ncbi:DNA/RNA polymerase [Auricularia subglabra TFB-10046 SS5]|nr:DNA/RNA polymerase [Auricularia subglabra TFB-10046 SS5]